MTKNRLDTIWDDRVLARSFDIFGGVPAVLLEAANSALPKALKNRLGKMTTLPVEGHGAVGPRFILKNQT
jgi:hypothetical protein